MKPESAHHPEISPPAPATKASVAFCHELTARLSGAVFPAPSTGAHPPPQFGASQPYTLDKPKDARRHTLQPNSWRNALFLRNEIHKAPPTPASQCCTMDSPSLEHAYTGNHNGDPPKPRQLPPDLPTSLDDRREVHMAAETEMYDAWQGELIPRIALC